MEQIVTIILVAVVFYVLGGMTWELVTKKWFKK